MIYDTTIWNITYNFLLYIANESFRFRTYVTLDNLVMNKKIFLFILYLTIFWVSAKKTKQNAKPDWAKKDIRDYTDADMERLLDQWEVSI